MDIKYHKWLELEVTHNYFVDNVCPVLNLLPMGATSQVFKNHQILMKRHSNKVSFYIGLADGAPLDILKQFEGISNLYFQVVNEDNFFFNYTGIEFSNEQELLFFSNLNKDAGATQLQGSQFTDKTDLVSKRPKIFNLSLKPTDTLLEVKTHNGTVVMSEDVTNAENSNYTVHLENQESGVYQLFLNGVLMDTFFMTSERIELNAIGVVQLDMETIKNNYDDGFTYHIDFNAKAAHRKYKVVLPTARRIEVSTLEIKGMENEKYNGPVKETLIGEQMAEVFTSDIPLPLKQKLDKHPQLNVAYTSEFSNRTNELEIKLPNPGVEGITKNTNEENEVSFFSSTIIYV
ncbi:MAG: hypothetical protein AAF489_06270 [Bacteroidota bacterium]